MIIKINQSKLFTVRPSVRFSNEYDVDSWLWDELWRRYKFLDYSVSELCEYFLIKSGKKINRRKMDEWIFRAEIYRIAKDKSKFGASAVNSDIFGELEQRVIRELFRHLKSGDTKKVKVMA